MAQQRVALVTGVGKAGQVGEAVARRLAADGWRVALVDRGLDDVSARATELTALGYAASAHACDLTDPAAVEALARAAADESPDGLQAVVHVAGGFLPTGGVADTTPAQWERLFAINLTTAFLVTRALLPALRRGQGALVYFASEAALPGATVSGMGAYAASKAAVVALMRAVAQEEREHGVRANALAPSAIRTASNEQGMSSGTHFVERDAVADAVAWLCSGQSRAITGQLLHLT
ncbi:MAG: short-chain dehydrogenase/reductase [Gemmatimonadetes bacterium]|nr:short-chain dehydrogenase/reductase [Gemmatimonadota bacterium]